MEERRSELDPDTPGMPSVNGLSSPAGRFRPAAGEFDDLFRGPADEDGGSGGGSGEPPDGLSERADEPGSLPGDVGDSLDETDWEATRYLAAATQLDLSYARSVVSQIVGQPFRAVAPAAGVDVVVVTRLALAVLRRRALRDAVLTCLLIGGLGIAVGVWTWIPVAVMAALAVFVVAYERWVRDVEILARRMLRGRFRAHHVPSSSSQRIEDRLAVVQRQQKGNLVVFRGRSSFVGSGEHVVDDSIVVNVALGRKGKDGKRQRPIPFTTQDLYAELEVALKNMDFPDMRVGQRLYVNGEHVASYPRLLPDKLGPPVPDAPVDLLRDGCNPGSEARTYVYAEIGGWKGQLVVSLFTRAVQVHGSLEVKWSFYVLPPLYSNLLLVDQLYELPIVKQIIKATATGLLQFAPALVSAPVTYARYAILPLTEMARMRDQSYRIRRGYVFNYGSPRSIREGPVSYRRAHDFVVGDELTFIMLAQHTLLRALGRFLKAYKVDMKQFASQEQTIINKVSKYNVDKISAHNVAVGNKSHASDSKKSSGPAGG